MALMSTCLTLGTVAVAVAMLLELILLAGVEVVNLGSLKWHFKFCGVNGVSFSFALYIVHCTSGSWPVTNMPEK